MLVDQLSQHCVEVMTVKVQLNMHAEIGTVLESASSIELGRISHSMV